MKNKSFWIVALGILLLIAGLISFVYGYGVKEDASSEETEIAETSEEAIENETVEEETEEEAEESLSFFVVLGIAFIIASIIVIVIGVILTGKTDKDRSDTKKLVEAAMFIAIATVLSCIKIFHLPYGGSVTIASMLPIVIISYRSGIAWGVASGFAYGVIQQLLGLNNLSYATSWQAVIAIILLDYLLAYAVVGLAGMFRKVIKKPNVSMLVGAALVCILRYVFHVISGATVWAGLSIPNEEALIYSMAYNASFLIPETIVLLIAVYYVGSLVDFRSERPMRLVAEARNEKSVLNFVGWFLISGALVFDIVNLTGQMQKDSGEFDFSQVKNMDVYSIIPMIAVTALAVTAAIALFIYSSKKKPSVSETEQIEQ